MREFLANIGDLLVFVLTIGFIGLFIYIIATSNKKNGDDEDEY